jgi:uncharacterized membrane protein YkvA (DUF1232 family)
MAHPSEPFGSGFNLRPDLKAARLGRPLSTEEMDAIRHSMRDERKLGLALLALLKRVARNIPFAKDALSAWYCAIDPTTPPRVKAILLAALGYFILPFDVIPDMIPLLGFGDDAAVLAAAIAAVAGAITELHREKANQTLDDM